MLLIRLFLVHCFLVLMYAFYIVVGKNSYSWRLNYSSVIIKWPMREKLFTDCSKCVMMCVQLCKSLPLMECTSLLVASHPTQWSVGHSIFKSLPRSERLWSEHYSKKEWRLLLRFCCACLSPTRFAKLKLDYPNCYKPQTLFSQNWLSKHFEASNTRSCHQNRLSKLAKAS